MTDEQDIPPTFLGLTIWYGLLTLLVCVVAIPVAVFFTSPSSWVHHTWRKATAIFPSNASGTIVASGAPGNFVMHITKCYTGERQQFFGVNFFDEDQPRTGGHLVLPIDEDPYISLNDLNTGGSQIYRSTSCRTWDAELHHGWRSYARVRNMVGHVRFDCQYHDPETHVSGDLTFRSCQ